MYTKEHLNEDFAMGAVCWAYALSPILFSLLEPQPLDSPLWSIMKPAFIRFTECLKVTGAKAFVEAAAK